MTHWYEYALWFAVAGPVLPLHLGPHPMTPCVFPQPAG